MGQSLAVPTFTKGDVVRVLIGLSRTVPMDTIAQVQAALWAPPGPPFYIVSGFPFRGGELELIPDEVI